MILDVDGTPIDSNGAHAHAWQDAFAEEGITVPYARVRRAIGTGGDKLLPAVARIEERSPQGQRISAPYDVEAALRAGIDIVGLECGGWPAADLRGAAAVYASPADLLAHYELSPFARLRAGEHARA